MAAAAAAAMSASDARMTRGLVYLLHFDRSYVPYPGAPAIACAGHYTGFAPGGPQQLKRRLAKHGTAAGARLMLAVAGAGIGWELARTWPGSRIRERQLKKQGGASRRCPKCGVTPRPGPLPRNADGSISRSLTSDREKAAAGMMTAARLAEHTILRRGAAAGKLPRPLTRGPVPADVDPWALPLPAPGPAPAGGQRGHQADAQKIRTPREGNPADDPRHVDPHRRLTAVAD
jgi:hypothetical protein